MTGYRGLAASLAAAERAQLPVEFPAFGNDSWRRVRTGLGPPPSSLSSPWGTALNLAEAPCHAGCRVMPPFSGRLSEPDFQHDQPVSTRLSQSAISLVPLRGRRSRPTVPGLGARRGSPRRCRRDESGPPSRAWRLCAAQARVSWTDQAAPAVHPRRAAAVRHESDAPRSTPADDRRARSAARCPAPETRGRSPGSHTNWCTPSSLAMA